jgi:hypothetical protein
MDEILILNRTREKNIDLQGTENMTSGKYFNKGVKALDAADIGHVVRETPDKIVVLMEEGIFSSSKKSHHKFY